MFEIVLQTVVCAPGVFTMIISYALWTWLMSTVLHTPSLLFFWIYHRLRQAGVYYFKIYESTGKLI